MNFRWGLYIIGACLLTINSGCKKELVYEDTLVYGHAGTTIHPELWVYPANTKESVLYALDVLGAEGVEIDIQMTKDSVRQVFTTLFWMRFQMLVAVYRIIIFLNCQISIYITANMNLLPLKKW